MPFSGGGGSGPSAADYTAARAALIDRLALLQAGGAGELTIAGAALIPRLALLAAGGAGELTAARAANLTNLDTLISGRLGAIASIQTAVISMAAAVASATATITAVNLARSIIIHLGNTDNTAGGAAQINRLTLTNSTTVTADRVSTISATTVRFMVIEFAA